MDYLSVCAFGIIAVVLCVVVRKVNPESALGISIAAGLAVMASVITAVSPSIKALSELSDKAGIDASLVKILLKALAICYITSLCADCARDAGEGALGSKLELAGRAAIAVVSLPVFTQLADYVTGMLK